MNITIIGDIMLGRFVQEKYHTQKYGLVSDEVLSEIRQSDYVIANLESPVTDRDSTNSLAFAGSEDMLSQLEWVDCFSLANNHINDFGETGMVDTIANLEKHAIKHNGLFENHYVPHIVEKDGCKIAVVMCTDMLNYEFDEGCKYKVLRADAPEVNATIKKCASDVFFTILFSHCGSLFSRFPNPEIRDLLHSAIDAGASCVVTAHSHCLGGVEMYKGIPIIHSLGDFLMDGRSYRRRRACILSLKIYNNALQSWSITPTITNKDLQVVLPTLKEKHSILNSLDYVSNKMQKKANSYDSFYKFQYKKEMMAHSMSTLHYLYDTKGFCGFLKMLKVRYYEVIMMLFLMIMGRQKKFDPYSKHILKNDAIR